MLEAQRLEREITFLSGLQYLLSRNLRYLRLARFVLKDKNNNIFEQFKNGKGADSTLSDTDKKRRSDFVIELQKSYEEFKSSEYGNPEYTLLQYVEYMLSVKIHERKNKKPEELEETIERAQAEST